MRRSAASAVLVLALASGCAATVTSGTAPPTPAPTPRATVVLTPTPRQALTRAPTLSAPPSQPLPPAPSSTAVALIADSCVDRDVPAPPTVDPVLTVLDRTYALDQRYAPDLVPIGETGFEGQHLVATAIVADLGALYRGAHAAA